MLWVKKDLRRRGIASMALQKGIQDENVAFYGLFELVLKLKVYFEAK